MAGTGEAQKLHQFQQIVAKLHSNESVQEGVHAAAQEGDTLAYVHSIKEAVIEVAHGGVVRAQSHHHVIRKLADDEHGHHGEDHLKGFIPLEIPGLHQGLNDAAVTEDHHERRQDEAQHHLADYHGDTGIFALVAIHHAGVVGVDVGVNDLRQGEDHGQHPSDQGRYASVVDGVGAAAVSRDSFGDGEVPVHADAHQQEHTAEEGDLVHGVHGLARNLPELPLGHDAGGPEGQR